MICCYKFAVWIKEVKRFFDGELIFTNDGIFGLEYKDENDKSAFLPINYCPRCGKKNKRR